MGYKVSLSPYWRIGECDEALGNGKAAWDELERFSKPAMGAW